VQEKGSTPLVTKRGFIGEVYSNDLANAFENA
jgi:hypothetical protein